MKTVLEVSPEIHTRIKALADANPDVTLKQATNAILRLILPEFEDGRAKLVSTQAVMSDPEADTEEAA